MLAGQTHIGQFDIGELAAIERAIGLDYKAGLIERRQAKQALAGQADGQ